MDIPLRDEGGIFAHTRPCGGQGSTSGVFLYHFPPYFIITFVYYVWKSMSAPTIVHMGRLRDRLWELVLFFYQVGAGD